MAMNQEERNARGREGEALVASAVNGDTTTHKAPFDVVDFKMGVAYEVKTMSGYSKDLKIHISDKSMARKVAFAGEYDLAMVLIAVVIYSSSHAEVYSHSLVNGIRVNQMTKIADNAAGWAV